MQPIHSRVFDKDFWRTRIFPWLSPQISTKRKYIHYTGGHGTCPYIGRQAVT